jgi:hypothetical protein
MLRSPPRPAGRQETHSHSHPAPGAPIASLRHHYAAADKSGSHSEKPPTTGAATATAGASFINDPAAQSMSHRTSVRASPDRDQKSGRATPPMWAPSAVAAPGGSAGAALQGYPGYPYHLPPAPGYPYSMPPPPPGYMYPYVPVPVHPQQQQQQQDGNATRGSSVAPGHAGRPAAQRLSSGTSTPANDTPASPIRRDAVEAIDVEISSRLERKSREIDALTKQNVALRSALSATKETFDENVAQLKECQAEVRRLEENLVDRDVRLRELEQYRDETAARIAHVDDLVRREKDHASRVADDFRRQLDAALSERANLEARVAASQEDVDKARHEVQLVKRQFTRDVHMAEQQLRLQLESETEDKVRGIRAKVDDKEGALRHLENEVVAMRGEVQRERDRADAFKTKLEQATADMMTVQHRLQQAQMHLEENRQARDADVAALRRENEGLRQARDELQRSAQGQMLTVSQESARRSHDVELLAQQVTASKAQMDAEMRRHRSELEELQRAFDLKLKQKDDEHRASDRERHHIADQAERLRKQLAEERTGRDFSEGERDALQDKIVSLQRVVAKRDTEIQRLTQQLQTLAVSVEEKSKEAEAVQSELDLREARDKKDLALVLDQRLKEFRSVGRMRHQASYMGHDTTNAAVLEGRFNDVSQSFVDAAVDASHVVRGDLNVSAPYVTGQSPRRFGGARPSAYASMVQTPLRSPAVPYHSTIAAHDVQGMTPIAHEASAATYNTLQRGYERQLAAERDRVDALHRQLADSVSAHAASLQHQHAASVDDGLSHTLNAAEAAVQRARAANRGGGPGLPRPGGRPMSRSGDDASSVGVQAVSSPTAPSPRAERLRQVSESLKTLGQDHQ